MKIAKSQLYRIILEELKEFLELVWLGIVVVVVISEKEKVSKR